MKKYLFFSLIMLSVVTQAADVKNSSHSNKCPKADTLKTTFKDQVASWDNCFGSYVFNFDDEFKGNKYEGEFKQGLPHGKGKYFFSDGEIYDGDWANGVPHGNGIYKFKDGRTYNGEYVEGQKTKGKLKFLNGSFYQGFFRDGVFNGEGILFDKREKILNEGIWADGKIVTPQITQFSKSKSQSINKGRLPACPSADESKDTHKERIAKWSNCHGIYEAKIEPMKGMVIEANFFNGSPNGFGKFTYPDNDAHFEGTFRNGELEFGLLKFSKESKLSGESFYGWFSQSIPHGYGQWQYANGNFYEGQIKDGKPDGAGIMFDKSSGEELEGIWQEGRFVKAEKLEKGRQIARSDKKPIVELDENILDNLATAKKKCVDLGFKENTEKFGFCVLKMSRQ
jgi:hypothetical protein